MKCRVHEKIVAFIVWYSLVFVLSDEFCLFFNFLWCNIFLKKKIGSTIYFVKPYNYFQEKAETRIFVCEDYTYKVLNILQKRI